MIWGTIMTRPPLNDINENNGLIGLGPIPGQAPVAAFNIDLFQSLLQTKGFLAIHYKHTYNPDRETVEGPSNINTQATHRGFQYYDPRPVRHVPQSFSLSDRLVVQGVYGVGSVVMNMTLYYTDMDDPKNKFKEKIAHFAKSDIIIFPSLTDIHRQNFQYNPNGPQRLQFKAKGISRVADKNRVYVESRDFEISDEGFIVWLNGKRPGFSNGKGDVVTCVYYYSPIYYVQDLLHSLRVIPSNSTGHGALPREAVYAPQQLVCKTSELVEEFDLLAWQEAPPYPGYPDTKNTTGGSV
jgi:hypothetical protein